MIGKLSGTLTETNINTGLIETPSGVSYEVFLPPQVLGLQLPTELSVYTYLQVREDALILFGFQNKAERDLFKMMLSVSGVGPKTAFLITSFAPMLDTVQAIKDNNPQFFTRVPGLGKKTALKIILELSTKLDSEFKLENLYISDDEKTAIDALISLGFKAQESKDIVAKLPKTLTLEEKIKEGIKLGTNRGKKQGL